MWHVWETEDTYRVLVGRPDRNSSLEDLGVDGRIILNWIFKKWNGEVWTGGSGSG
jgi:hypothetical protein